MTLDVLPGARAEVREAALYFDALRPSKYDAFMALWDEGLDAIVATPRLFSPADDAPAGLEVREYLFRRFQRRIVYLVQGTKVVVLALAHTRQQPGYWHDRVQAP